jgi:hypothetical protein
MKKGRDVSLIERKNREPKSKGRKSSFFVIRDVFRMIGFAMERPARLTAYTQRKKQDANRPSLTNRRFALIEKGEKRNKR